MERRESEEQNLTAVRSGNAWDYIGAMKPAPQARGDLYQKCGAVFGSLCRAYGARNFMSHVTHGVAVG